MRRTIVTLDTKDGKYIPVFVVMEELYPDMQDYNDSSLHKRPNSYAEGKDNLSLSIEDFSKDNPFELNGSCGSLEIIGEYAVEPGNDLYMLLPSINEGLNTLGKVLPIRECPREVKCMIEKDREVWGLLAGNERLQNQLRYLTKKYLGFDLTLYPEHIGNFYWVRYNASFKKLSFRASNNPNGLIGEIAWRKGKPNPLRIIITDKHSGYPVYTVIKELNGTERAFFIDTPLYPNLLTIEVQNDDGKNIMLEENVTFLQGIMLDMGIQTMELKLKKQGKKAKDNYEVSIPKFTNASKSFVGDRQTSTNPEYFTIADSLSRQKADQEALNFVFFDGELSNKEKNVRQAKETVRRMISMGKNVSYICDPYFNADDFVEYVYYIQNLSLDVKVIVCKSPQENAVVYKKRLKSLAEKTKEYNEKMGRIVVECRSLKGFSFHDRFLYADETGWLLGSSFSEFGHRTTTICKIPRSHGRMILDRIKSWWTDDKKSEPIV